MNGSHTKKQQDWMDAITEYGCVITGDCYNIQRHHVYGVKYKHNKILIGPWYQLPLHYLLHDLKSTEPVNVTHNRTLFTKEYGLQKDLFWKMCINMTCQGIVIPFGEDVMTAIMDTTR